VLQCHYHGWTYLLDGQLRGVPDFDRVDLFDKRDYGLIPVRVDVWQGLIFVNLLPAPEPLSKFVEGIAERILPMRLDTKTFYRRVSYTVKCNWKVYADNYLEGYHLPIVHPELTKMLDYRQYVTETFRWYSLQHSPFSGEENVYTRGDGNAYYYFIFPNFTLNILPGRLQTNLILPIAHDSASVIFDYYYDDITSPSAREMIERDMVYAEEIQQEDIEICEHVQRGLMSKAYRQGRFSVKREAGVHHFQSLLKEAYRSA
jgi:choline monooxygenase